MGRADGAGHFGRDAWLRAGGGGGTTRVLAEGALFEKVAVNVSHVHGRLDPAFARRLQGEGEEFAAVGLSLILHPRSPMVPTSHANLRFIVQGAKAWFGGGADLTYYLFEEDAAHFHRTLRAACDRHLAAWYPRFKKACDDYFFLPHRGERRGVGGIFFEDLGGDPRQELSFVRDFGQAFLSAYLPIAERRHDIWHSSKAKEKEFIFVSYNNPEVDELLEKGRRTFDIEERKRAYFRIQEILAEELPYIFLYVPDATPIVHARFKGIKPSPIGISYNLPKWFVPKRLQRHSLEP